MKYRVLALDGGGTWALIQVKALTNIYGPGARGHQILSDFDLAAANSGGSIVLGGLLDDLTLAEILDLFEDQSQREAVFSPTHSMGDQILRDIAKIGPKYSAENKLPALENALPRNGNVALTSVTNGIRRNGSNEDLHVLIIGFDYDRNRGAFFRSSKISDPRWGTSEAADVTMAEAIHASSNAPVNYFDEPATFPHRPEKRYWDGAISGCNNPILTAVTEAIMKGKDPLNIAALSIGTGSVVLPQAAAGQPDSPYLQAKEDSNLVNDLKKLATAIVDDPPDAATFLAHVMTGSGVGVNQAAADSRVVRMSPLVSPVKNAAGDWTAPGTMTPAGFGFLAKLDMDAVKQPEVDAISKYADLWLQDFAMNQPIRMNGSTLSKELGQDRFSAALAAWNAIR